jgi:hypothetical protein
MKSLSILPIKVTDMADSLSFKQFYTTASPASLRLLIHLTYIHPPDVQFPSGGELKRLFGWTDRTVYGALKELRDAGILIKVKHHGTDKTFVNPVFVWKGDDVSRLKRIRWINRLTMGVDQDMCEMSKHPLPEIIGDGEDLTPEEIAEYERLCG